MWYGTLPKHWETKRIKNLFSLRDERNNLPMQDVCLLSLYTSIGVIPHNELEKTTGNRATTVENYKIVYAGDIIVNIILCWQGAIGLSKYSGVTSPAYDIYKPKTEEVVGKYFHYLMRTSQFSGECYKLGHGIMAMRWRTYSDEFTSIVVPIPPRNEQDQIVRFLDWKVSKINSLINNLKKQITLLNEQKQAVINARLCGRKVLLKRLLLQPLKYGANESGIEYGSEFPRYVRITDITSNGTLKSENTKSLDVKTAEPYLLKDGDILLARSGATVGKSFLYENKHGICAFAGYLIMARFNQKLLLPEYFGYITNSSYYEQWKNTIFIQATIQNISAEKYGQFQIPLPTIENQQKIIESLDIETAKFSVLVASIEKEVFLLIEYRNSLISNVVTGKIDVRGVVVPEFEAVDEIANEVEADSILCEDAEVA
jgi:type I restriction enzyme S subunit